MGPEKGGLGPGLPGPAALINVADPEGDGALDAETQKVQLHGARAGLAAISERLEAALKGPDEQLAAVVEHDGMTDGRVPMVKLQGTGGIELQTPLFGAEGRALWRSVLAADAEHRPAQLRAFLTHMKGAVDELRAEAERLTP